MANSGSPYRIGVVGLGRGFSVAQAVREVPNARLVAVADLLPERLDAAAREFGEVARYDHHQAMLQHEALDVVVVATLGLHHREPVVDAAAAGVRGVYVEKPMATRLADCDAMIAACREAGTVLTVGHQRRWSRSYAAARDAIRAGAIGRPINGSVAWSSARIGSVGTHFLDVLNMVVDDQVAWVSGRLDPASRPQPRWPDILDPGAMGLIVYRNGLRVALDAMEDTCSHFDILLTGNKGKLHVLRDAAEFHYWARDAEVTPLEAYRSQEALQPRELPGAPTGARTTAGTEAVGLAELLECIERRREPSSTGTHGRHALETIVALHLSSRQNMQPVHLPLTGEAAQLDLRFR
jgi:predicted dehydrogenase